MPILGNGDIASVLTDREDRLYMASGVSNSLETRDSEFQREKDLLFKQSQDWRIVYFSSLSIFYKDSPYTKHKRKMEQYVKMFPKHTIIRLGNIAWGKNPNTLINYLKTHPDAEIRDEYRFVIEKEEFLWWINLLPNWNCEMNLSGRRLKVKEIYEEYVSLS